MSKNDVRRFVAKSLNPDWKVVEVEWLTEWMKDLLHPRKNPQQRFVRVKVKHRRRRRVQRKLLYVNKAGLIAYGAQDSVRRSKPKRVRPVRVEQLRPIVLN